MFKPWQRDRVDTEGEIGGRTLGASVEEFLRAAEEGRIRDGSGEPYSPDALRELRGALAYVAAELGGRNLEDVLPNHVQQLVDRLRGPALSNNGAAQVLNSLGALYRYAIGRGLVTRSPVGDLTLGAPSGADAAWSRPDLRVDPDTTLSPNGASSWPAMPVPEAQEAPSPRRAVKNATRRGRSTGSDLDSVIRDFLRAADEGRVDRRPDEPYTFETLLDVRGAMSYVDDGLREMELGEIRRRHIQKLVDDLKSRGLPSSLVVTVVDSLRALYAFAIQRDLVDFSPVVELGMPVDDYDAEEDATWSQVKPVAPPPAMTSAFAPAPFPPYFQPPVPTLPPAATIPPQPPPAPYGPPTSAPNWEFYDPPAREPVAPTTAMMALGGRVVTWATRLALIVFVLLVLVLARELGLASLIP